MLPLFEGVLLVHALSLKAILQEGMAQQILMELELIHLFEPYFINAANSNLKLDIQDLH
jgi:hypothetical protein